MECVTDYIDERSSQTDMESSFSFLSKKWGNIHTIKEAPQKLKSKDSYPLVIWEKDYCKKNNDLAWVELFEKPYYRNLVPQQLAFEIVYSFFNKSYFIPNSLKFIIDTIEESKYILSLEEDWDDDGAKSPNKFAYTKAIEFLLLYSIQIYKESNVTIPKPIIYPTFDGSVYLHWDSDKSSFLIIFKDENQSISYFYGESKLTKVPFKGGTIIESNVDKHIAIWMKEYLS